MSVKQLLRKLIRRARRSDGTALVELALVMPLLLILLLGMIDFGKAFNAWIDETHLSNEAARLAAVNSSAGAALPGKLQQYIQEQADTPELKSGRSNDAYAPAQAPIRVCITFPKGTQNPGDPVKVTVSVTYNWLNYLTKRVGVAGTPITGTATMRLEQRPSADNMLMPPSNCYPA